MEAQRIKRMFFLWWYFPLLNQNMFFDAFPLTHRLLQLSIMLVSLCVVAMTLQQKHYQAPLPWATPISADHLIKFSQEK